MEKIQSEWSALENFVGYNVPVFLKLLLWKTGYDSLLSIKGISNEEIQQLEQYVQRKRDQTISEVFIELNEIIGDDNSISEYKEQEVFEFLPGHRTILMSLQKNIDRMQSQALKHTTQLIDGTHSNSELEVRKYSVILTELLKSANQNFNKSKYAYQYNDVIKYFSTYIFLLCGRTCYETLNKNLPIPSTKTICK